MDFSAADIKQEPHGRPKLVARFDSKTEHEIEDNGIVLVTTNPVAGASQALPTEEFEAREKAHQIRVSEEESRIAAEVARHKPAPRARGQHASHARPTLPNEMEWDDLKYVCCRWCSRTLLSPSCEFVREESRGRSCLQYLPHPVHARIRENFWNGFAGAIVTCEFFVCKSCVVG